MGARFVSALLTAVAAVAATATPALAYYPDDHVWDREFQSGVEWTYQVPKKPVPWMATAGASAPAPAWWGSYAPASAVAQAMASAPAYAPAPAAWTQPYAAAQPQAWDGMAWNVAWWDPSRMPLSNQGYHKAVFDSAQNPYADTRMNNDLATAAAYGDLGRVKALVAAGADIHARDWEGYTPLTWAAQHGRFDVANYLLSRYAQPNAVDRWGYTPLMWAVQQGHTPVAALLIQKGANPRAATPYGVNAQVLATYAAAGRSRPLVDAAIAGKPIDYAAYLGNAGMAAAPRLAYAAPVQQAQAYQQPAMASQTTLQGYATQAAAGYATQAVNQAGAQALSSFGGQPMAGQAVNFATGAANGAIAQAAAGRAPVRALAAGAGGADFTKIQALSIDFGRDFKAYMSEAAGGNFAAAALAAAGPEMQAARELSAFYGTALRERNPQQARQDLDAIKATMPVGSRFANYVKVTDETLRAMGV